MRRIVIGCVLVLFFLMACSSVKNEVQNEDVVRLFLAMDPEAQYSEKRFKGEEATALSDLVSSECPNLGERYTRAVYASRGVDLVLYIADGNIVCSLLKPDDPTISYNPRADAPEEGVAAEVNGVRITTEQVQAQLTAVQGAENPVDLAVNQLINDELLRQQATGIELTDDDRATARETFLAQAGITEEDLGEYLEERGLTEEDVETELAQQSRLSKLLSERLLTEEILVTDDELLQYYANNPNQFLRSEQAVMRQILVAAARGEEGAVLRAQEAVGLLESRDFCELVRAYSDDQQSVDSCGVYVVPRGVINPDLEFASFNTPANQTSVVRTDAGIHLVQSLQVVPAQVVPYQQAAENLRETLVNAVFQQRLNLYLVMLRSDADIQVYLS